MILLLACLFVQDAATWSFTEREGGSHPGTVRGREQVEVMLSSIPRSAVIHRAVFRPGRDESEAFASRDRGVRVTLAGSDSPLPLLPPRFASFDVTEAVRAAVASDSPRVAFSLADFPGYRPMATRLDVTGAFAAKSKVPRVRGIAARHRAGQTLLTWTDPRPVLDREQVAFRDFRQLPDVPVRFRIYRSERPFGAATVGSAELVDEVGPLTGWNPEFHGISPRDDSPVRRFVVEDGKLPVPPGTGVYAHNPAKAGKAWYFVSVAVNGEEDLSAFDEGNALKEPVEEEVGPGLPVLQRVERPASFNYVEKPELHYFVRWEAPPRSNRPSRPFDYLVALPPKRAEPAPAGLHLHCWGANLEGGYGWWYDAAQGALLLSTNQAPYDWWTGYHEFDGTWKPWKDGVVRDYTQARLVAFLDWTGTKWKIDPNRVFTAGNSMGGSGSPSFAIRHPDRVAWAVSWVGVHTPARTPQFRASYERVYGSVDWKLPFQDGKTAAFDWFDDAGWLRRNPAAETPLLCFSNGKNDGAIGWPQARDFWKALQETRRPHVFVWGQAGHGQRAMLPGASPGERELGLDIRLDRTLPAFTNGSLDGKPGNGDPADGDPEGQSNLHLVWDTSDEAIVDEEGRWSLVLHVNRKAPADEGTVDVTPRRCRNFRPKPGQKVSWWNRALAGDRDFQSGEVSVDAAGLVTVPQVRVRRGGSRLILEVKK